MKIVIDEGEYPKAIVGDVCSNGSGQGIPYESGLLPCGVALETATTGNLCKIKLR